MAKTNKKQKYSVVKGTQKNYYSDDLEKDKKKEKNFFSKRNIILIIFFFILSLVILWLTVRLIMNIDWNVLFSSISSGFGAELGTLWFVLLITLFIWSAFACFATLLTRFNQYKIKVSPIQYVLFAFTSAFLRCVTPTPFITDSYTIFWLKTQKIPTHLSTSIAFSNTLIWQFVQEFITLPSFIVVMVNYRKLIYINGVSGAIDGQGLAIMILACVGIFIDLCCIAFMLFINMSKKMHYALSSIFNWIKKKLHMKYHTKQEIAEKYKTKAVLKQDFIDFVHDKKAFIWTTIYFVLNELITYISLTWAMHFVSSVVINGKTWIAQFSFIWAFNCANVSFTANRLNLLPNGVGGLEWILATLLEKMGGWKDPRGLTSAQAQQLHTTVSSNGILVWRLFSSYLLAGVGLFTMTGLTISQVKKIKSHKLELGDQENA